MRIAFTMVNTVLLAAIPSASAPARDDRDPTALDQQTHCETEVLQQAHDGSHPSNV